VSRGAVAWVAAVVATAVVLVWLQSGHWALNNVLGVCICVAMMAFIKVMMMTMVVVVVMMMRMMMMRMLLLVVVGVMMMRTTLMMTMIMMILLLLLVLMMMMTAVTGARGAFLTCVWSLSCAAAEPQDRVAVPGVALHLRHLLGTTPPPLTPLCGPSPPLYTPSSLIFVFTVCLGSLFIYDIFWVRPPPPLGTFYRVSRFPFFRVVLVFMLSSLS
jgi:hypothetical protein